MWAKTIIVLHFHTTEHANNKITGITGKCIIINQENDTQEIKIRVSSFLHKYKPTRDQNEA